jgi:hypothetical protein
MSCGLQSEELGLSVHYHRKSSTGLTAYRRWNSGPARGVGTLGDARCLRAALVPDKHPGRQNLKGLDIPASHEPTTANCAKAIYQWTARHEHFRSELNPNSTKSLADLRSSPKKVGISSKKMGISPRMYSARESFGRMSESSRQMHTHVPRRRGGRVLRPSRCSWILSPRRDPCSKRRRR